LLKRERENKVQQAKTKKKTNSNQVSFIQSGVFKEGIKE